MKGKPNFFLSMQLPLNVGLPHRQCDFCKRENAFCELQSREGHKIAFTKENEQQRFRINLSKSLFKCRPELLCKSIHRNFTIQYSFSRVSYNS